LQKQFSDGDICISVHVLYILANETANGKSFAVELNVTFDFLQANEGCINTQPKQSNLIVPPITVCSLHFVPGLHFAMSGKITCLFSVKGDLGRSFNSCFSIKYR